MELDEKLKISLEKKMCQYLNNKETIDTKTKDNKKISEEIKDSLIDAGLKSYKLFSNEDEKGKTFTVAEKTKVSYDTEKIKGALDKELFSQIVDREISVDYDTLVKLAKKYNIPAKEIKECLKINESVNGEKLEYAYETGKIDLNNLKGMYTIDKSFYLTVR